MIYQVKICGIETTETETTTITIGPFENSEKAINEAEDLASKYYRIHYLELINNNITEIIWNLDD